MIKKIITGVVVIILLSAWFYLPARSQTAVNLSVAGSAGGQNSSSTDPNVITQQLLADIERRIIAIAIELARLMVGLPPNTQGGAYPGVESLGITVPGGNILTGNNSGGGSGGGGGGILTGGSNLPNESGQTNRNTSGTGGSGSGGNMLSGGSSGGGAGVSSNKPFGGLSTTVVTCTCRWDTPRSWITLKPAKSDLPSQVIFEDSSSILYEFRQIKSPGQQLLGTVTENTTCRMQVYWYCVTVATVPKIYMVGTSGGSVSTGGGTNPPPTEPPGGQEPPATTTPPTTPPDQCKRMGTKAYTYSARGTGYYPANTAMEGGFEDRLGKPLRTLQQYLSGQADYVSVAMDSHTFLYGTELCIPELERKYGRQIIFRVVDTGGAFTGMGTGRIDICTANAQASVDGTINGPLTLVSRVQSLR